jgi:hypothetical protein
VLYDVVRAVEKLEKANMMAASSPENFMSVMLEIFLVLEKHVEGMWQ